MLLLLYATKEIAVTGSRKRKLPSTFTPLKSALARNNKKLMCNRFVVSL